MGKLIRIFVAIVAILSFVLLARSGPVGAAKPGADSSASQSSVQASDAGKVCLDKNGQERDCEDDNGEKDDEDDKGREDDDDGTVKPPKHRIKVCKTGTFSVGGMATIQVKKLGRGDCVTASTIPYDPDDDPPLPKNTSAASDILELKLPKKDATVKFCFAAPPGKKVTIYTYSKGKWESVGGSVSNGKICGETSKSGSWILLKKK